MRRPWRRLDVRLFASYALVALVVIGALGVTVSLVAPAEFDNEFPRHGDRGGGRERA